MKDKVISSSNVQFVRGGSNKMFGKSGVGNQEPGITSTTRNGPSGGRGGSPVRGGTTKMFGKSSVKNAKPL